ncbi:MAG: NAD(P)-dependent glycerol-3-phosphate dehydrogenase [Deltaproteobacteria bacterium]|nr:NAD(P)-dependent glycerol-3-phosphate dehydrogenase [Deltaproteobacteria bacterium]
MSAPGGFDLAVLGGGSFGTALSTVVADRGHRVRLWVRREEQAREINEERTNGRYLVGRTLPEAVVATADLEAALRDAPVVLLVVPSRSFRDVARAMGNHLRGDQILVHATKGIEVESFLRMSEVLRQETCARKVGVLSGPNLAAEIVAGHPAGAVVASRYDEVVQAVQRLFRGAHLRVYGGRDVVGVEVGGAFKNVVAIAAGVLDGLGLGDNARSLLLTRGLGEMAQFGVAVGADVFTFGGLAGVGDLSATAGSKLSRNHQVGEKLATGAPVAEVLAGMRYVVEGVPTTAAVHRRARQLGLDLPIVAAVHALLYDGLAPADALGRLMALPVGDELAALRVQR